MTFVFGTSARAWLDGKQAACAMNEITLESELDEAEVTTLCSTIKDYIPGLAEVTVEMEGYFDTNTASPANTLEAWLDARMGTVFPLSYAPDGGGQKGDAIYLMNGFLQEYTVESTVDEAAATELTFRATSGLSRGKVIQEETTQTVSTNGLSLDNVTATTDGGIAILQVSAVSGTTPTMVAKIQHSVDNSAWVDLVTFSSQNAVNGEYVTVASGTTVNRYLRVITTIGGTSPSFTFNVGFKRL